MTHGIRFLIFAAAVSAVLVLPAVSAEAHRDGCHRWHSCPSDTGSYVCGDLGHACRYPTYPSGGGAGSGATGSGAGSQGTGTTGSGPSMAIVRLVGPTTPFAQMRNPDGSLAFFEGAPLTCQAFYDAVNLEHVDTSATATRLTNLYNGQCRSESAAAEPRAEEASATGDTGDGWLALVVLGGGALWVAKRRPS